MLFAANGGSCLICTQCILRLQNYLAGRDVCLSAVLCLLLYMFVLVVSHPVALVNLNIENKCSISLPWG